MDLSEYLEETKKALQRWLDVHTDAESWAREWFGDYEDDEATWLRTMTDEGCISNNYFHVDIAGEALKLWVEDHCHLFSKCPCGMIWESGYDNCDTCNQDEEGNEVEYELEDVEEGELTEYMREMYDDVSLLNGIDHYIWKAMVGYGFRTYRHALASTTAPVEEECEEVLKAIEEATSREELLIALAWANHTEHVHGNILQDYGYLDYKLIDRISQEGIGNVLELDWENVEGFEEEELCYV